MSSAGQAIGGVVGAVVGFFTPLGPVYGAQIGMMIGGVLDPPRTEGPRLEDLTAQTSVYGAFIPRLYGTTAVTGNIIWIQGDRLIEHSVESDGKGGPVVTNFEYFATFAVGLCEGPIDGVRRIWIGGQLWYDAGSDDLATIIASNEASATFTLYTGTDTQLADPLIQADRGASNVPAYRGLAYIVFDELPLKDYGNSLVGAQVKVEVVKDGSVSAYPWLVSSYDMSENQLVQSDGILASAKAVPTATSYEHTTLRVSAAGEFISSNTISIEKLDLHTNAEYYPCRTNPEIVFQRKPASGTVDVSAAYVRGTLSCRPVYPPVGADTYYSVAGDCVDSAAYIFLVGGDPSVGDRWISRYDKADLLMNDGLFPSAHLSIFGYGSSPDAKLYWDGVYLWALVANGDLLKLDDGLNILSTYPGCPGWISRKFIVYDENFVGDAVSVAGSSCVVGMYRLSDWALVGSLLTVDGGTGSNLRDVWPISAGVVYANSGIVSLYPNLSSGTVALSTIVESECLQSGLLTASDLDVTELTDQVRGYRVSSLSPLRGGIDQLRKAWPFDAIQHGYKIKFKKRGGASVATITEGELDAREAGANPGVRISNVREMDLILPQQLTVQYMDSAREYDVNVAEESR